MSQVGQTVRVGSFGLFRWEERRFHSVACSKGMVMLTTPLCCFLRCVLLSSLSETKSSHRDQNVTLHEILLVGPERRRPLLEMDG